MHPNSQIDLRSCAVETTFDLVILSDIRFVREALAQVLGRDRTFRIVGVAVDTHQACRLINCVRPRVILVDTCLPSGTAAVSHLRECASDCKIVAFALRETEEEVIAWAQAGIWGYIPRNTSLTALVTLLHDIVEGQQVCHMRIASGMLHWIAQNAGHLEHSELACRRTSLTAREQEVSQLIVAGLSNKEIARGLGISLATTKSHVHNILAKLGVARRALAVSHLRERRGGPAPPPPAGPADEDPASRRDLLEDATQHAPPCA
jgi:DNA-binding NarL/FixJ family response regulator